jgi:hypothetical protein
MSSLTLFDRAYGHMTQIHRSFKSHTITQAFVDVSLYKNTPIGKFDINYGRILYPDCPNI